jgi:hypothetical protein
MKDRVLAGAVSLADNNSQFPNSEVVKSAKASAPSTEKGKFTEAQIRCEAWHLAYEVEERRKYRERERASRSREARR